MSETDPPPVPGPGQPALSETQLADLAALLSRTVTRGNLGWLATSVLGRDALREVGNDVGDVGTFARGIVDALHRAGRMGDAVTLLRQEAHRNSRLTVSIEYILRGGRLDDGAATQAFVNEYEPFLSSSSIQEMFPRVLRTVCAVALGEPHNRIVGSGFLIAPDQVLTNFHVLDAFLKVEADGTVVANGPGSEIFCFFDYLWAPAPDVPPGKEGARHACIAVRAQDDWLVRARPALPGDGTAASPAQVAKEYDYAVIRLERPVGGLTARLSGGAVRGWLPLPDGELDVLGEQKRIVVFQHPGTAPQQFDIGQFEQLDPSATRVWYSVSSAKGSSGGAAVDSEGKLFALHNAEVKPRDGLAKQLNQGVRIDYIARDLRELPGWKEEPLPEAEPLKFWSLSDDPRDPRPIIGRETFRQNVAAMSAPGGDRLLVVTGPPCSGRRFSIKLLRRTLGTQTPVVEFSPRDLQTLSPRDFLRFLVDGLGLPTAGRPIPEPVQTESVARWLRLDLPQWLSERLAADAERDPSRYPAWVVINAVSPEGERLLWADYLKEFVAALASTHGAAPGTVDFPQLRWLFLATTADALPVMVGRRCDEDLSSWTSFADDFASCLQLAWRSVDKQETIPPLLLRAMAQTVRDAPGDKPLRDALASAVRNLVVAGGTGSRAPE